MILPSWLIEAELGSRGRPFHQVCVGEAAVPGIPGNKEGSVGREILEPVLFFGDDWPGEPRNN